MCVSIVRVAKCSERRMETRGGELFCERILHNAPHHPVRMMLVLDWGRVQIASENCDICVRESNQAHLESRKMHLTNIITVHLSLYNFGNKKRTIHLHRDNFSGRMLLLICHQNVKMVLEVI